MEPIWRRNWCKNRSKTWCILGSIFERIWKVFGSQNGAMLAPKSIKNRCDLRKADFRKIIVFPLGKTTIFKVRGVQVGSKNRSKIDQKRRSTWEGILASIFERFWWILGGKLGSKIEQKSIQKGIEKVMKKRRAPRWILMCFLGPSWNGKWPKNAYQKAFKKRLKKEGGHHPGVGTVHPFP